MELVWNLIEIFRNVQVRKDNDVHGLKEFSAKLATTGSPYGRKIFAQLAVKNKRSDYAEITV